MAASTAERTEWRRVDLMAAVMAEKLVRLKVVRMAETKVEK
jgi:hypothetical protein